MVLRRGLATVATVGIGALGAACMLPRDPPPGASGPMIYEYQNCANCHGEDRRGKTQGPPLTNLAEHWTRANLIQYLADPKSWIDRTPRLRKMRSEYSGEMSSYGNLTYAERKVLAEWLLTEASD